MRSSLLAFLLFAAACSQPALAAEKDGLGVNVSGGYAWARTGGGNSAYPVRNAGAAMAEVTPGFAFGRFFVALDFHYFIVNPNGGQSPVNKELGGTGWAGGVKGEYREGPWVLGLGFHFIGHEDFSDANISFSDAQGVDASLGYQLFPRFPMTVDAFVDYTRFHHQSGAGLPEDISDNPLVVWGAGVGVTFRFGPQASEPVADAKNPEALPDPVGNLGPEEPSPEVSKKAPRAKP